MGSSQSTGKAVQNSHETSKELSSAEIKSGNVTEIDYIIAQYFKRQLQYAVQRENDERVSKIEQPVNTVAAVTFEQFHSRLKKLLENNSEESTALTIDMSKKLSKPLTPTKSCVSEEAKLVRCLTENINTPLACLEHLKSYFTCSSAD